MRDLAPHADLETLYGAAKFAAAREGGRTTHPLLRDARGLSVVSGDVTGLLTVTGKLTGSRDPAFVDRESLAPAMPSAIGVNRPGASFQEESARPPVRDRRREGFPDRHAPSTIPSPLVPSQTYVPRSRYGFQNAPGRHQGHPVPRGRAADRRCSADPRPVRWPQVHVMNVQPPPPELARSAGPSFHPMTPRRTSKFPPATASVGWSPCFSCGRTGHRLMSCAKYLQECARDPLRTNRCFACNAVGLCPADCRRRLHFAT